MNLESLRYMLDCRLLVCERNFKEALMLRSHKERYLRIHHMEGVLSDAWQAYCSFIRQLLIQSSVGCVTSRGVVCAASVSPTSWERVSYMAIRAVKGKPISPMMTNSDLWKEPTWGDSSKVTNIVGVLSPANSATLIGSLAGGLLGPRHCQIVRNACAHRNHETKAKVAALAANYIATRIKHPVDAMTWKDQGGGDFAFLSWIEDMKIIAAGAVR